MPVMTTSTAAHQMIMIMLHQLWHWIVHLQDETVFLRQYGMIMYIFVMKNILTGRINLKMKTKMRRRRKTKMKRARMRRRMSNHDCIFCTCKNHLGLSLHSMQRSTVL
jgi:hypothetical protein